MTPSLPSLKRHLFPLWALTGLCLSGCQSHHRLSKDPLLYLEGGLSQARQEIDLSPWTRHRLATLHLMDAQGMTQTYSSKERLRSFAGINPLHPQPYHQVIYQYKNSVDEQLAILVRYYPSGRPMQLLTSYAGSARGWYCEWFEDGQLHLKARIVGGRADFSESSQQSWIFDGESYAFDEEGSLEAKISYENGRKEGKSIWYHEGGEVWQEAFYVTDQLQDCFVEYAPGGNKLLEANYRKGLLEGELRRYNEEGMLLAKENYQSGALQEGHYYNDAGAPYEIKVLQGRGVQPQYIDGKIRSLQEIDQGYVEGRVAHFSPEGALLSEYSIRNGVKEGEGIEYYQPSKQTLRNMGERSSLLKRSLGGELFGDLEWLGQQHSYLPWKALHEERRARARLRVSWDGGEIRGICESWYPDGQLESQRGVYEEKNHGSYTAYYPNGDLRIIEEYHHGQLLHGKYWKLGDSSAVSTVDHGTGTATFFDDQGKNPRYVRYVESAPLLGHDRPQQ